MHSFSETLALSKAAVILSRIVGQPQHKCVLKGDPFVIAKQMVGRSWQAYRPGLMRKGEASVDAYTLALLTAGHVLSDLSRSANQKARAAMAECFSELYQEATQARDLLALSRIDLLVQQLAVEPLHAELTQEGGELKAFSAGMARLAR